MDREVPIAWAQTESAHNSLLIARNVQPSDKSTHLGSSGPPSVAQHGLLKNPGLLLLLAISSLFPSSVYSQSY